MSTFRVPFSSFEQAVAYLYSRTPVFQRVGGEAYKPGLLNIIGLLNALGNPHQGLRCIHVGGTNGKGSSSHLIAAILQSAGFKTGLYTSPHLKSFTERIKVNGIEIGKDIIVEFLNEMHDQIEIIQPSFFEVTTALAFYYFKKIKVDYAIIEVGLGGRLDSTNVIEPMVSLITNIGHDHLDLLGPTLKNVAFEKAGIIKKNVPVVISERQKDLEQVFLSKSLDLDSPIWFAEDHVKVEAPDQSGKCKVTLRTHSFFIEPDLKGIYQIKNLTGVIQVIEVLKNLGLKLNEDMVCEGIKHCTTRTGLKGRWQLIRNNPRVICDTGHNQEGLLQIIEQLNNESFNQLRWVFGVVGDKPVDLVLSILPKEAKYYFCRAISPRSMSPELLAEQAGRNGLKGIIVHDVNRAIEHAVAESNADDLILVGGSTYVVADVAGI